MILHMMNKAKAPCGTDGSDAVKVFPFSDFDFAEPFGSAIFLSYLFQIPPILPIPQFYDNIKFIRAISSVVRAEDS
jgi:hypothetical protein